MNRILPWTGLHPENGSPSYPGRQEHTGWWLCTEHWALKPQEPTHGSRHLERTHARWFGQSWWMRHSGRQLGGAPNMPEVHEHTARESTTRHSELGPQGDGIHGLMGAGGGLFSSTRTKNRLVYNIMFKSLKWERLWRVKSYLLVGIVGMDLRCTVVGKSK